MTRAENRPPPCDQTRLAPGPVETVVVNPEAADLISTRWADAADPPPGNQLKVTCPLLTVTGSSVTVSGAPVHAAGACSEGLRSSRVR